MTAHRVPQVRRAPLVTMELKAAQVTMARQALKVPLVMMVL